MSWPQRQACSLDTPNVRFGTHDTRLLHMHAGMQAVAQITQSPEVCGQFQLCGGQTCSRQSCTKFRCTLQASSDAARNNISQSPTGSHSEVPALQGVHHRWRHLAGGRHHAAAGSVRGQRHPIHLCAFQGGASLCYRCHAATFTCMECRALVNWQHLTETNA